MTSVHTRRREDRPAADPFKQCPPTDKHPHDYDPDRRRNRSATLPFQSYDPRSYPSHDPRYNDSRPTPRSHRQDPHYSTPATHSSSYHHSSAQAPSTSKAYQHATRPSAQYPSSAYHYPQPSSHQPSHPTTAYPAPSTSRKPHLEPPDPRPSRRPAAPTHQSYEQVSSGEDMPRAPRRSSRVVHPSTHPPLSAPPNQPYWNIPQEVPSSRRHKDPYRDRDKDRDREREKERHTAELENKYRERARAERHRDRERERAAESRYQEPSRSRHDRRKDSDTEGVLYSEQRNVSKASLSGREGYSSSVRDAGINHKRHRTEEGTTSTGRRHQPENTQNPISTTSQPPSMPQPDVQQTGEPPPAPRVMPVYLPPKAKSQRLHREGRPSTAQGAQSGSDTERAIGKYRMERTPSGPAVQRSDAHASSSMRDRSNHDVSTGTQDDMKRSEPKSGMHHDTRQPLAPINVDIPLVTPGVSASALPADTRTSAMPQIVSIRAGQGPSDPHDMPFKSSAISHSDAPQGIVINPPPTSASIRKSSSYTRSQVTETRPQSDRLVVGEQTRTEPRGDDLPPGQRMSIHESNRALPSTSKPSYARASQESGVDNSAPSYPHSRPPSRSAHQTSINSAVPPAVLGPRPIRSVSQGAPTNEPLARPRSVVQLAPNVSSTSNQHSVPPSPAHLSSGSPPRVGPTHSSSSSTQPSPKNTQLHGISTQQPPSVPPSVHPTPVVAPQTLTASSRPPTRDGVPTDAHYTQQSVNPPTADVRPGLGLRQTSNSTTVKASWIVQTPATAKRAKISQEDKYLRDHHFNSETPHVQLRQVLSEDDGSFPRASSSMMKASWAATPSTTSQRNSPGTKSREVLFGTPRGTLTSNSPKSGSAKEAPTPEHASKQNLSSYLSGPPQIAVFGATPDTPARDLPQLRVDHALLVPPFPPPNRVSRTTSGPQVQDSQPPQLVVRSPSLGPVQPQLAPTPLVPPLFQLYRPPSLPVAEECGQFSPPPLPIPPPRGFENSPPPPVETRASEIIPARLQSDAYPIPEVQSEILHIPSQPSAPSQSSSSPTSLPRTTRVSRPTSTDGNTATAPTLNGTTGAAFADTRSSMFPFGQPENTPVAHQEIMESTAVLPSQPSAPARLRPKVTIEDVPEDSPVLSKATPPSVPTITPPAALARPPVQTPQHTPVASASSIPKSTVVDQFGHKYSPQSRSKDPLPHRGSEPNPLPGSLPTPAPSSTRMPPSAPPTQSSFVIPSQAASVQRATSHTVPSRTYQRTAEMLQASKLSASTGASPGTIASVSKAAAPPMQTNLNPVSAATSQHQLANSASAQDFPTTRLVNNVSAAAAAAPTSHPSPSTTALTNRAATHATASSSGPAAGALGLHISPPSADIGTHTASAPDPPRPQPSRSGALMIPVEAPSTNVMPTTTVRSAYQDQQNVDTTRSRDVMPSTNRNPPPSIYPTPARPSASSAMTQQVAQPSTHNRAVSLPVASLSSVPQRPSSPRKYSHPTPATTVSTQPFPSRPSAPESQPARTTGHGYMTTPAPVRSARPSPPTNDLDMLKTPSSIAPSPMLNPDNSNTVPLSARVRHPSTDSKDDKKKPSGLFGLFRTRTLSSKAADPLAVSTVTRASLDQGRVHTDAPVAAAATTSAPRGVKSTATLKESNPPPLATASTSTRTAPQQRMPGSITNPHPTRVAREHRDATPHIFTPFKFLTMHSKRNRTVSAASLDVCDGNTATNTAIGSPDHSIISQAPPLPHIMPPGIRDPLIATSEWRDREEAERRERKKHRIRRPGVTFDVEEDPPSPAPGTMKRKKLTRRPSGRTPTPGPSRS